MDLCTLGKMISITEVGNQNLRFILLHPEKIIR